MPDATRARQAACAECRRHLVTHPNWDLRPVCRTDTGTIANATDAEHAQAYLQHDIHGEEIVRFFLQHVQSDYVVEPSGIRIIVYTRFDSVHLDPQSMALVFGRNEAVAASRGQTCLDFELYNNTGAGISGHHYEPSLPARIPPCGTQCGAWTIPATTRTWCLRTSLWTRVGCVVHNLRA